VAHCKDNIKFAARRQSLCYWKEVDKDWSQKYHSIAHSRAALGFLPSPRLQ